MSLHTTTIIGREMVAENVVQVTLDRPDTFHFDAGQYAQFGLTRLSHPDPRGPSRVFSLASSPHDTETISFAFRRSGSGFKRSLEEAAIGSEVAIAGPYGFNVLSREPRRPLALVANGVGITPQLSMIRFAAEQDFVTHITLFYVNRAREKAAYLGELEQRADRSRRFTLRTSTETVDNRAVQEAIQRAPDSVWHLTGAPTFVARTRDTLTRFGVDNELICMDEFIGY